MLQSVAFEVPDGSWGKVQGGPEAPVNISCIRWTVETSEDGEVRLGANQRSEEEGTWPCWQPGRGSSAPGSDAAGLSGQRGCGLHRVCRRGCRSQPLSGLRTLCSSPGPTVGPGGRWARGGDARGHSPLPARGALSNGNSEATGEASLRAVVTGVRAEVLRQVKGRESCVPSSPHSETRPRRGLGAGRVPAWGVLRGAGRAVVF